MHAGLAGKVKGREPDAWNQFDVFSPVEMGSQKKDVVDTRWVSAWREVGGMKTVKARFAAKGE